MHRTSMSVSTPMCCDEHAGGEATRNLSKGGDLTADSHKVSSGSPIMGHESEATTHSARINTLGAPRGVSDCDAEQFMHDGGSV